jgi:hypothetical protein
MRLAAAAALVLVACSSGGSDHAADCAKVRKTVDEAVVDVPRRYRDEALRDARPKLQQLALNDASLKRAVLADDVTYERIQQLCTLGKAGRERDCAEVRTTLDAMLPFLPAETGHVGILDEGLLKDLERRTYDDPAVQAAVREMARETGAAFYTGGSAADAASKRARAAYDKLAAMCRR